MIVRKKTGKTVKAYCLGAGSAMEQQMIAEEKMKKCADGSYELFSQEAVNETGEKAQAGDYFKVDSSGFPYPNAKEFFEKNHIKQEEADTYIQIPAPLQAWTVDELECEEIAWLKQKGKLTINEADTDKYFSAFLWGTLLSTPKDSVVVFYGVTRDGAGQIVDVDFNFVARDEFERTYDIINNR